MATTPNSPAAGAPGSTQIAFDRLDSGQAALETAGVMFRAAESRMAATRDAVREHGDCACIRRLALQELNDAICLLLEGSDKVQAAAKAFRTVDTRTGGSF